MVRYDYLFYICRSKSGNKNIVPVSVSLSRVKQGAYANILISPDLRTDHDVRISDPVLFESVWMFDHITYPKEELYELISSMIRTNSSRIFWNEAHVSLSGWINKGHSLDDVAIFMLTKGSLITPLFHVDFVHLMFLILLYLQTWLLNSSQHKHSLSFLPSPSLSSTTTI